MGTIGLKRLNSVEFGLIGYNSQNTIEKEGFGEV